MKIKLLWLNFPFCHIVFGDLKLQMVTNVWTIMTIFFIFSIKFLTEKAVQAIEDKVVRQDQEKRPRREKSPNVSPPRIEEPVLETSKEDWVEAASIENEQSNLSKLSQMTSYDLAPVRTVELTRDPEWNLGISIVGGRALEGEEPRFKGIYIKHVLETSSAGQSGSLKTGDQILEVSRLIFVQDISILLRLFVVTLGE